jgi:radical SAM protein (TIGR04043 family)
LLAREADAALVAEVQARGVELVDPSPLVRRGGAGPSDHVALTLATGTVMVPVRSGGVGAAPFRLRILRSDGGEGAALLEEGLWARAVALPRTPRFYALTTADGIPYPHIALLHGERVLASTVLQTCTRYADAESACRFCAIGDSLRGARTVARKTPAQLAEVAEAAVRLDGIEQVVLTTGTPASADRGAAHLAACAAAIKGAVPGLPVQVQLEPPEDFGWFERLRAAGADAIGLHLEAVEPEVRARVMPGKAAVPVSFYLEAMAAAVAVFGRGRVVSYLIAGLGDTRESLVEMAARLVAMGVYPFVVPFVPLRGTPMEAHPPPEGAWMRALYRDVAHVLREGGMRSEDTLAGCAKCGACSALSSFEKEGA